jgi:hypothetical protein
MIIIDLSKVYFASGSHQRYENDISVRGQQKCDCAVKIENSIMVAGYYNWKLCIKPITSAIDTTRILAGITASLKMVCNFDTIKFMYNKFLK